MTNPSPGRLKPLSVASVMLAATIGAGAQAQPGRAPPPTPAPSTVPAAPQRTTATFGDWTLRCDRSTAAEQCELAQTIGAQGQAVAQIAIGRASRGEALHLTVLVPVSVTLTQQPRLGGPGKDDPVLDLAWRRCLPAGCLASAVLPDDAGRQLRARTEPTRVVFTDAAAKEVALPLSPKGLSQALDALAREEGS